MTAVHPFFLRAESEASKEDKPNWHQAMNGPYADEYWRSAEKEVDTLEGRSAWNVVGYKDDMTVINGT